MLKIFTQIKDFLDGKKTYSLIAAAAAVALAQYVTQFDFQTPLLPVAHSLGEVVTELWALAMGATFRAAVTKPPAPATP